jgi:hypothetical protein
VSVVKKRTPPRKSSPKKRARKAARPARKPATKAKAKKRGVDFNPIKRDIRAQIARLEAQLGPPEAHALAADQESVITLGKLQQLNALMTEICQPSMVIGS